jgi:type IV pilus biogenesis protein CpaD/CtpE
MMPNMRSAIARRSFAANSARGLSLAALALLLAGCYAQRDTTGIIPTDYRERHPIALKKASARSRSCSAPTAVV